MIKIQNIYYMLAYAFQVLNEDSYNKIAFEDFEDAEDLLAAILAKGIANQIKRGLGREYILQTDALTSPRGKINISSSIKERTMLHKRLVCEFDEFSENAYINQILKTTMILLLRSEEVRAGRKRSLKKVLLYFSAVDTINPRSIRWTNIKYHSNNTTYKMLINVCYLVIEALLPTTQAGSRKLSQFKDDHLHRLYEKFVLAFYRKHYEHQGVKVSSTQIGWNVDDGVIDLLPAMKSDITLECREKMLIIDTKYYSRTMQTNSLYNSHTIHSGNLYQIFAYVKNKDVDHTGNVSGLLLYAKTDEKITPDKSYMMDRNRIGVKTLDLDKDFSGIREQLDKIIEEWLQ
jgi:5-methylcytosine-specific restriction enzyme subunit McrC